MIKVRVGGYFTFCKGKELFVSSRDGGSSKIYKLSKILSLTMSFALFRILNLRGIIRCLKFVHKYSFS